MIEVCLAQNLKQIPLNGEIEKPLKTLFRVGVPYDLVGNMGTTPEGVSTASQQHSGVESAQNHTVGGISGHHMLSRDNTPYLSGSSESDALCVWGSMMTNLNHVNGKIKQKVISSGRDNCHHSQGENEDVNSSDITSTNSGTLGSAGGTPSDATPGLKRDSETQFLKNISNLYIGNSSNRISQSADLNKSGSSLSDNSLSRGFNGCSPKYPNGHNEDIKGTAESSTPKNMHNNLLSCDYFKVRNRLAKRIHCEVSHRDSFLNNHFVYTNDHKNAATSSNSGDTNAGCVCDKKGSQYRGGGDFVFHSIGRGAIATVRSKWDCASLKDQNLLAVNPLDKVELLARSGDWIFVKIHSSPSRLSAGSGWIPAYTLVEPELLSRGLLSFSESNSENFNLSNK